MIDGVVRVSDRGPVDVDRTAVVAAAQASARTLFERAGIVSRLTR
jgi:hypothetical protein